MTTVKMVGKKRFWREVVKAQDVLAANSERPLIYEFDRERMNAHFAVELPNGHVYEMAHNIKAGVLVIMSGGETVEYRAYRT